MSFYFSLTSKQMVWFGLVNDYDCDDVNNDDEDVFICWRLISFVALSYTTLILKNKGNFFPHMRIKLVKSCMKKKAFILQNS